MGNASIVEGDTFDEESFFRALSDSGARVLLIGRRALVALGLPVLTAAYDLWCDPDDLEQLNRAVAVRFADVWARREAVPFGPTTAIQVPSIDDLILTKRFGGRPKDLTDIELLQSLKRAR